MSTKAEDLNVELKKSEEAEIIAQLKKAIEIEELKLKLEKIRSERLSLKLSNDKELYADSFLSQKLQEKALRELNSSPFTPSFSTNNGTQSAGRRSPTT